MKIHRRAFIWIVCCSLLILLSLNISLVLRQPNLNIQSEIHVYIEKDATIRIVENSYPAQNPMKSSATPPEAWDKKFRTMLTKHERRLRHLANTCTKWHSLLRSETAADWSQMYVDDQRRYVYCLVSKASCTNWKRTLMLLTGLLTGNDINYKLKEELPFEFVHNTGISDKFIKRMIHFNTSERLYRLDNYYKFVFVREPLERLVSAYRDKIFSDRTYYVDQLIIGRYKGPTVYNNVTKTFKPTFSEFIRYVLDERSAGKILDRHWRPQNELCRPCRIHYDFIGHQETVHTDADYVLTRLKETAHRNGVMTANITFPADSGHSKSGPLVEKMYSEVPSVYVQRLFELYADDYELFNFKRPNISGSDINHPSS